MSSPQRSTRLATIPTKSVFVTSNTRKRFPPLDELKSSIAEHGILQPIRVHDEGEKGFRLIAGECRFRCAKELKLAELPASIVAGLTEDEILAEQLCENGQRKDIHPMEEAEGFDGLRQRGKSIEEIALAVGKSRSHVLLRLKLCDLLPPARKAFYEDKMSLRVAYALARVPSAELQRKAWKELSDRHRHWGGDAAIEQFLRTQFTCNLEGAPFDRRDATLVPAAGACGPCPHRTQNARDLFGDISDKDVCTNPECFSAKTEAAWTKLCEEALASGHEVLDDEESRKLFPHGAYLSVSDYVDLDVPHPLDGKRRTWGQLLSKSSPPLVYARDTYRRPHRLVLRKAAIDALKDRGYAFAQEAAPSGARSGLEGSADRARAERERNTQRRAVASAAISAVVREAVSRPAGDEFWHLVLFGIAQGSWNDVVTEVVKRRGWAVKGEAASTLLLRHAQDLQGDALRGLALELIVGRGAYWAHSSDYGGTLKQACATYGVDLDKLATELSSQDASAPASQAEAA